jgi:hypothetical protein
MEKIIFKTYGVLLLIVFCVESNTCYAQSYFKFPITKEGVYGISQSQISSLGFSSLDDVAFFGTQGAMPQTLDSSFYQIKEIPSMILNGKLIAYLAGPHRFLTDFDSLVVDFNPYSDSLFYLIGKKTQGKRIGLNEDDFTSVSNNELFHLQLLFWQNENLINSGRNWFSKPFALSRPFTFSFDRIKENTSEYFLVLNALSQSFSEGKFDLQVNGIAVPSIPTLPVSRGIYDVKGNVSHAFRIFNSSQTGSIQLSVTFDSRDNRGVGYLNYSILGTKVANPSSRDGVYYNLSRSAQAVKVLAQKNYLKVAANSNVSYLNKDFSIAPHEKMIVFSEPTPIVNKSIKKTNLNIRQEVFDHEFIIISPSILFNEAQRLALHKNSLGIKTSVVLVRDIFDAFGYGNRDVSAIRDFLAFQYHQYGKLKNVLFFGRGTYDYKGILKGRPNLIPIYTSRNSLDPMRTYSSDDFFGFLDFGQGEWKEDEENVIENLSIGVGRIPAINTREAKVAVDKIIAYENPTINKGNWRLTVGFLADDGDNNIHKIEAENRSKHLNTFSPQFRIKKLYIDRFKQVGTAPNQTVEEGKNALVSSLKEGLLLLNYIGHGNENTLTSERIFTSSDLAGWPNFQYLPLFITSTCEFGRYDSPILRSGAEELLFIENKGAIGLLTTTRPVFSSVNFDLNKIIFENIFNNEKSSLDLGEIYKRTKNLAPKGTLNRNFSLIGDPSMRLIRPQLLINNFVIQSLSNDSIEENLLGLKPYKMSADVLDVKGNHRISDFSGQYDLQIFDEPQEIKTLGDENPRFVFQEENVLLFQGKGEIKNGKFESQFILPSTLGDKIRKGKVRVYSSANDSQLEASGYTDLKVRGINQASIDTMGPEISAFWDGRSEKESLIFSTKNIEVLFSLRDESGINIHQTNANHNIELYVNGTRTSILNNFFIAHNNDFREGTISTILYDLNEGINVIVLKVRDNAGNLTEKTWTIEIINSLRITVNEIISYPNPTTDTSNFIISHNRPFEPLLVNFKVYNPNGVLIFEETRSYSNPPKIINDFKWEFSKSGNKSIKNGVYIYFFELLSIKDGTMDVKSGKVIIQD